MIIETSAIVAIAFREPERETFIRTILSTDVRMMSVSNLLEATSVIEGRRGTLAGRMLFKGDDFAQTDVKSAS